MVAMFLGADWTVSAQQIAETLYLHRPERVLVLVTPREVGGGGSSDAAEHARQAGKAHPTRILAARLGALHAPPQLLVRARRPAPRPRRRAGLARFLRRALPYAAPGEFPGPKPTPTTAPTTQPPAPARATAAAAGA